MKLRILNSSVRLRLSMDDMESVFRNKMCQAVCKLPGNNLTYQIETSTEINEIDIINQPDHLLITIPEKSFLDFYHSNDEGVYHQKQWNTSVIAISIERDYKCLTPRSENEDRLYMNPRKEHG